MRQQDPNKIETPVLKLKVGDRVRLRAEQVSEGSGLDREPRKVDALYDQTKIPGGVKVYPGIGAFVSWNEDALERVDEPS